MVDIYNDTDMPELVHWHGQMIPSDVDGAAEEGTPFVPAHGMRRIAFVPKPAGFRFYHTHVVAGGDLNRGTYTGQAGPVYIEPKHEPGAYDREVFLVMKEFEPSFSRGGDMAMDMLAPGGPLKELEADGRAGRRGDQGNAKGYEVGYELFSINGKMLGAGEPIRVKQGERVLFHVLNASATEIRSLALPGHVFRVVALDGNPVPTPAEVPVLWLGTAERISAIVEMNHPGVFVLGDLSDDDRGRTAWASSSNMRDARASRNGSSRSRSAGTTRGSARSDAVRPAPDETIEMTIVKHNAAANGFNLWTLNGEAFSMETMRPLYKVQEGRRYRLKFRNASDDIHPLHLHRHSFELTRHRRQADRGRDQGRGDAGRLSGGRIRLRRRQSGPHAVPLSPAAAHGFRLHGAVRLRVIPSEHCALPQLPGREDPWLPRDEHGTSPGLRAIHVLLAFASLFADISTEMLYPVLPVFLTQTLRASGSVVGLVEGIAQATQNIVQGFSGWLSDRLQRRKPMALVGYLLGAVAKPLMGLASSVARGLGRPVAGPARRRHALCAAGCADCIVRRRRGPGQGLRARRHRRQCRRVSRAAARGRFC